MKGTGVMSVCRYASGCIRGIAERNWRGRQSTWQRLFRLPLRLGSGLRLVEMTSVQLDTVTICSVLVENSFFLDYGKHPCSNDLFIMSVITGRGKSSIVLYHKPCWSRVSRALLIRCSAKHSKYSIGRRLRNGAACNQVILNMC